MRRGPRNVLSSKEVFTSPWMKVTEVGAIRMYTYLGSSNEKRG